MKKLLIVAVAVTSALAFSSCAKDRIYGCTDPFSISYNPNATDDDGTCFVPSSQKVALMGDFTATWCQYCGQWGAPEFEKAITGSGTAAIPLGIHNTDEITSDVSQALTDYYGADGTVSGYPTLLVWNQGSFYDGETMAAAAFGLLYALNILNNIQIKKNPLSTAGVLSNISGKKLHNNINTSAGRREGFVFTLLPCISILISTA